MQFVPEVLVLPELVRAPTGEPFDDAAALGKRLSHRHLVAPVTELLDDVHRHRSLLILGEIPNRMQLNEKENTLVQDDSVTRIAGLVNGSCYRSKLLAWV